MLYPSSILCEPPWTICSHDVFFLQDQKKIGNRRLKSRGPNFWRFLTLHWREGALLISSPQVNSLQVIQLPSLIVARNNWTLLQRKASIISTTPLPSCMVGAQMFRTQLHQMYPQLIQNMAEDVSKDRQRRRLLLFYISFQ